MPWRQRWASTSRPLSSISTGRRSGARRSGPVIFTNKSVMNQLVKRIPISLKLAGFSMILNDRLRRGIWRPDGGGKRPAAGSCSGDIFHGLPLSVPGILDRHRPDLHLCRTVEDPAQQRNLRWLRIYSSGNHAGTPEYRSLRETDTECDPRRDRAPVHDCGRRERNEPPPRVIRHAFGKRPDPNHHLPGKPIWRASSAARPSWRRSSRFPGSEARYRGCAVERLLCGAGLCSVLRMHLCADKYPDRPDLHRAGSKDPGGEAVES